MKARTKDAYSPNYALMTVFTAVAIVSLFAGRSLWIPASRIENLRLRAIILAITDAVSSVASETGLDALMPAARGYFLSVTGLDSQTEWDSRYFNRRNGVEAVATEGVEPRVDRSAAAPSTGTEADPSVPATAAETLNATETLDWGTLATASSGIPTSESDGGIPDGIQAQVGTSMHEIHSSANPLKVFFMGDSQVYSLGNGLSRVVGKDSPIVVDFLAVHSSGFIRGDYFNWPAKLSDTLASNSYDAVIVMLGMNDYQNFWDNQGRIMKKRTPEWEAAYADKCSAIIDAALLYVPRVYWIGMPRVKDADYEETLRYIDSVQERVASRYGPGIVVRCPIADALPGSAGEYLANVSLDSGKTVQAMSSDGSHFTVEGGQFAMKPLFDLFLADWLFSEIPVAHLPD